MNDSNFQKRVLQICEEALDLSPDQRESFLVDTCAQAGDAQAQATLRTAVDKLMRTIGRTSDFLKPVEEERSFAEGDQIGDYRIVRNIDRGGMGNVYLAEKRASGYSQRVALKVMRTYLQSHEMIRRFDEERRILARLHHPYIARLIDGGTTDKGLPYLVTELVEGMPIDQFCDEQALSLRRRLELVQKVAMALMSAHQNLIIHSDIKPGNILVTEDGIPKLLDFGVARWMPANLNTSDEASSEFVALTPEYSSPEQIAGAPVFTTSDVYSLGVLTYTLLVGETPFALKSGPREVLLERLESLPLRQPSEHVRALRQPDRQSQMLRNRRSSVTKLSTALRGDLDAVLAKALHREPGERYPSAQLFANDLNAYCKGLPVTAMGDSGTYRLRKFVGRNRVVVAAAGAAVLALVLGLGVSLWQAHIANERFNDLRGFAETVIFELHDEVADLPGGTAARQLMTRESLHYLDRLAKDAGSDRALQLDLSKAYKKLGDVLGNPTNANVGDLASSIESYRKALAIAEALERSTANNPELERHAAIVHEKLADVLAWTGDVEGALAHSVDSMATFERLVDTYPDKKLALLSVAISGVKQGDLLGHPSFPNAGRPAEALAIYERALALILPLAEDPEGPPRAVRYRALLHERVGTMLSGQGDFELALVQFEQSMSLRQQQAAKEPGNANRRRDAAIAVEKLADVRLASGDASGSVPIYQQALAEYRALSESDPDNANASRTLAIGLENLAEALNAAQDKMAARPYYLEALGIRETLAISNPANTKLAAELEDRRALIESLYGIASP
ncbi:MAG: protein kinase [Pseudomonadota bacterium]